MTSRPEVAQNVVPPVPLPAKPSLPVVPPATEIFQHGSNTPLAVFPAPEPEIVKSAPRGDLARIPVKVVKAYKSRVAVRKNHRIRVRVGGVVVKKRRAPH